MHRAGVRETFTTRNVLSPPREITLIWSAARFARWRAAGRLRTSPIAAPGSNLSIHFEFASPMLSLLLTRSFEKNCTELINAFLARARNVYGTMVTAKRVRVVYALAGRQTSWTAPPSRTRSPTPSNVPDYRALSGDRQRPLACAIFGQVVSLTRLVRPGDRVEILRPLRWIRRRLAARRCARACKRDASAPENQPPARSA